MKFCRRSISSMRFKEDSGVLQGVSKGFKGFHRHLMLYERNFGNFKDFPEVFEEFPSGQ